MGISTVKDFEAATRTPIQNNLAAIEAALVGAGAGALLEATRGLVTASTASRDRAAIRPSGSPGLSSQPSLRKRVPRGR